MYSRFKTRETFVSLVSRAKSSVTNGALKSSEIQILEETNQCKTVKLFQILKVSVCLSFSLKDSKYI